MPASCENDENSLGSSGDTPQLIVSPFVRPPPPYSPEHPHIILDHEKIPSKMADHPPPFPPSANDGCESPEPRGLKGKDGDIFHLAPSAALTLLSRYIELLISTSDNVPLTPPPSNPATPKHQTAVASVYYFGDVGAGTSASGCSDLVDGVQTKSREDSSGCAEATAQPMSVIHHGGVEDSLHYAAISRKFWCKTAPKTPVEEYLFRIHRFCPLSTAVYLAASYYLHRLSAVDHIIQITSFNSHRLVLAALRVAAKTHEDLSWPHQRFSKVGGLSELELSRLEISFCFLMDFELKVDCATLETHVEMLRKCVETQVMLGKDGLATSLQ